MLLLESNFDDTKLVLDVVGGYWRLIHLQHDDVLTILCEICSYNTFINS